MSLLLLLVLCLLLLLLLGSDFIAEEAISSLVDREAGRGEWGIA